MKPFDVSSMSNESLPWLATEMHGMRLVQKYNDFQRFSAGLRDNRERIIFKNDTKDFVRIQKRRVVDNNSLIEDDEDYEISKAQYDDENPTRLRFKRTEQRRADIKDNEIFGLMMPHCYSFNITEPVLLIRNRNPQDESFRFFLNDLRQSLKSKIKDKLTIDELKTTNKKADYIIYDMYIQNITDITSLKSNPISLTHKRHLTGDTSMYYSVGGAGGSETPLPDLIDIFDVDDLEPIDIPDSDYFEEIEELFGPYTDWVNHHP